MNLVLELAEIEKQVSALISENINLKKENAELRAKESFVGDQNRKLCDQQQKIEVLEAENAELKKKNLDTQDAVTMQMYTNKANKEIADRQLTKAKEIIRQLLLLPYANNEEVFADVTSILDKAEQFLKDSEVQK